MGETKTWGENTIGEMDEKFNLFKKLDEKYDELKTRIGMFERKFEHDRVALREEIDPWELPHIKTLLKRINDEERQRSLHVNNVQEMCALKAENFDKRIDELERGNKPKVDTIATLDKLETRIQDMYIEFTELDKLTKKQN